MKPSRSDVSTGTGLLILGAGLWLWFGAGPALAVIGALLVANGVGLALIKQRRW